ncbi:MAG: hypothetical protein HYX79_02765 [Chloroflexi bacterium]|nr:hypothetical protein [Chloroflexota bacterium]
MDSECIRKTAIVTAFTVALIAMCQELERPPEERKWHGKVGGFIPYEFRPPTIERVKEAYWNPYETRMLTPSIFGIGWAINFYALLENLGLAWQGDVSEESFLMPSESIKEVLTNGQQEV